MSTRLSMSWVLVVTYPSRPGTSTATTCTPGITQYWNVAALEPAGGITISLSTQRGGDSQP